MTMKVAIREALDSNEFTIHLGNNEMPTSVINNMMQSSANSLESGLLDPNKEVKVDEDKKTGLLTLNIERLTQRDDSKPSDRTTARKEDEEEMNTSQIA